MSDTLVKEIMIAPAPCVPLGAPLDDAVELLVGQHLIGVPVVDEHRRLVGFVTEQDCIHAMRISSYHCEESPPVEQVMSREPLTVGPEDSVLTLASNLGKNKPKSYPVLSDGELVGLVTRTRVLQALWDYHKVCRITV